MDPNATKNLQSIQGWDLSQAGLAVVGIVAIWGIFAAYKRYPWPFQAFLTMVITGMLVATILPEETTKRLTAQLGPIFGVGITAIAIGAWVVLSLSFKASRESTLGKPAVKIALGALGGLLMLASWGFSVVVTQDLPNIGLSFLNMFVNALRSLLNQSPDVPDHI